MGKSTVWQMSWNADLARYQIYEQVGGRMLPEGEAEGDTWLEQVSSFFFQSGSDLHVTALKALPPHIRYEDV